jgi:threonine synthase
MSDAVQTANYMKALSENGSYTISDEIKNKVDENFVGYFANETQTINTINKYYCRYNYLMDTHTAVAFSSLEAYRTEHNDHSKTVVASTANPYKFANNVYGAIFGENDFTNIEMLTELSKSTSTKIPLPLCDLGKKPINFDNICTPEGMYNEVMRFLQK